MSTNANSHLTTPTRLTGAEILWATLVGEGVTEVFGYPGGAILPVYDALRKFPIHHVLVRHEQGAAHMADGYARASGKVGVCHRHQRPRRDQPRHRHRHGDARFHSHRLHHRQRFEQGAGHRCVSGSGHHRHHAARDQAQFPRQQGGGHCARDPPRIPDCALGPARAGAGRHHQGRAAGYRDV